jgi:hypothetical protein
MRGEVSARSERKQRQLVTVALEIGPSRLPPRRPSDGSDLALAVSADALHSSLSRSRCQSSPTAMQLANR